MTPRHLLAFLILLAATASHAQLRIGKDTTLDFATEAEARSVLATRDDYIQRLSPFDRAAKIQTDRDVSEAEYLEAIGKNVRAWSESDKQALTTAFDQVKASLTALALPFPARMLLIKTTGDDEGNAPYTRGNAIIFPEVVAHRPVEQNCKTLCHELFHILSRANPALRDKLYATIGFVRCGEVDFPRELKTRKITNPDAPWNEHCIRIQVGPAPHWAVPILYSDAEKYDVQKGGPFFKYLQFGLLLVDRKEDSAPAQYLKEGSLARIVSIQEISGFFEQIGKNTGYIIHPEEVLADNFALLVMREPELQTPKIVKDLEAALQSEASGKGDK